MGDIKKTNPPIELKSYRTRPGYVTILIPKTDVTMKFIPEGIIAEVIGNKAIGQRRAVKVSLMHNGKLYLGWVDRHWFKDEIERQRLEAEEPKELSQPEVINGILDEN